MTRTARTHKGSDSGSFYSGGFDLWKVRFRWFGYAVLAVFCVIQLSMPSRHASMQSADTAHGQDANKRYASLDEAIAAASDTESPKRPDSVTVLTGDGASDFNDWFGLSIAIDGDTAIVGAPLDKNQGEYSYGAAYIYVRNGAGWTLQQKLSGLTRFAQFGTSVAISGDTVVVGSTYVQPHGAAYVYVRSGTVWSLQQELIPTSANNTFPSFGSRVAIDGDTILVSDSTDDDQGQDSGAVYLFNRSGATWSQQQKLRASDGSRFYNFGNSIAIDGDQAVVGSAGQPTGGALMYLAGRGRCGPSSKS